MLALSLVFVIASCGGGAKPCATCVDSDGDGICDVCKNEMPEEEILDVPLFEDGEPGFRVILGKTIASSVKQAVNSTLKGSSLSSSNLAKSVNALPGTTKENLLSLSKTQFFSSLKANLKLSNATTVKVLFSIIKSIPVKIGLASD